MRNMRSVERISSVNKEIIMINKEKDDLLPVGASEAVKATRPTHNYNQMLKSFNQSAVKT